jgi:hypothetical protein
MYVPHRRHRPKGQVVLHVRRERELSTRLLTLQKDG